MTEKLDAEIIHEALLDYKEKLRKKADAEDWSNDTTSIAFNRTTELCNEYECKRYNED